MGDNRDVYEQIGQEGGPEVLALVAAAMEQNARHSQWVAEQVQGGIERERDEWRERALDAEARLFRIEQRLLSLLD